MISIDLEDAYLLVLLLLLAGIPSVCGGLASLSLLSPPLLAWSWHHKCFLGYGPCLNYPPSYGLLSSRVSRRLACSSVFQGGILKGEGFCYSYLVILEEFLSFRKLSAKRWRVLLGHLASMILLVPGGRLRMRSLQ